MIYAIIYAAVELVILAWGIAGYSSDHNPSWLALMGLLSIAWTGFYGIGAYQIRRQGR